jgi:hypothetical protein
MKLDLQTGHSILYGGGASGCTTGGGGALGFTKMILHVETISETEG